jgi:hypothetical protein
MVNGPEFIELKNIGPVPLDLTGVQFVNGLSFDFCLGNLSGLFPGEHVVLVEDLEQFTRAYSTAEINIGGVYSGGLRGGGEMIELAASVNGTILDFFYDPGWFAVTSLPQFSLTILDEHVDTELWDSRLNWRPGSVLAGTPGFDDPRTLPNPDAVVINEVRAISSEGSNDRIEIYNRTEEDIDISNWYLVISDEDVDQPVYLQDRIALGTVVAARSYIVISLSENYEELDELRVDNTSRPDSFGHAVHLIAADRLGNILGYSDSVYFGGSTRNASFGRHVTAAGDAVFTELQVPTFGSVNSAPVIGEIIIEQIMYHPYGDAPEYVQLFNAGIETVELSNTYGSWRLAIGIDFSFPLGTTIPPGGRLLVVSIDPINFHNEYEIDDAIVVIGPFDRRLNNRGDTIHLLRPDAEQWLVEDQVSFNDRMPWPSLADEGGIALIRKDVTEVGDAPSNWTHSATLGDVDLNGVVDGIDFNVIISSFGRHDADWHSGDVNGDRQVNVDDYNLWFENRFTFASQTPRLLEPRPLGNRVPKSTLHQQVLAVDAFDRKIVETSPVRRARVEPIAADGLGETADPYLEPTTKRLRWRRGLNSRRASHTQPAGRTATDLAFEELFAKRKTMED